MAIFGKSENELKATQLDQRQIDLDKLESELKRKEAQVETALENVKNDRESFECERKGFSQKLLAESEQAASERTAQEERRQELHKLEAEAKAGFADAQKEVFKEVVEKRQAELDAYKNSLDELSAHIAEKLKDFHTKEGEYAKRVLEVTEREQKADAGFADKVQSLADEASRQHKANQEEAERLQKLADKLADDRKNLEIKKADIADRQQEVLAAEHKRDAGFASEREVFQKEMASTRSERLAALEKEVLDLRNKRLEEAAVAEKEERDGFKKSQREVSELQIELTDKREELERELDMLQRKEQRLEQQWQKRYDEIEDDVESRLEERIKVMEGKERDFKRTIENLREGLSIQTGLVDAFDQLKCQLGDKDPAEVLRSLNSQTDELKRLREELATRPTDEMRERYQTLETEVQRHRARVEELVKQVSESESAVAEVSELRRKSSELDAECRSLTQKANLFEGAANELEAELTRLRSAYEKPTEVAARHKEIEMPHIMADKLKRPVKTEVDELQWLNQIGHDCENYGLHFNPRILKAFHTALKTSEWSPVTVLAGVSGTGKSELPRLYSHFGGLLFESLSVQPNWDSQESMLGFFNSIDNKFDAQPVLRFLAQSQKAWKDPSAGEEGYPGLDEAVSLVLLDEMNLAHPELYFAEFLSKLESRRGKKGSDVPCLPVKVGAGLPPYQLPLGRNVLWTGTMNQDETTKSLSDKVLDRSISIYFPRPTRLKRRIKLAPLDAKNGRALLHKSNWQSWLAQGSSFSDELINPYKTFIEELNTSLSVVGRAVGHRVWQSVEYYMANYPDVRNAQEKQDDAALEKALHIAFEDQLVQKVMPKLRGIDTRGKGRTECLDKILGQINTGIGGKPFNLAEDFNLACELGYGQFIWQSANYLKEDWDGSNSSDSVVALNDATDRKSPGYDLSIPPIGFMKDKSDSERMKVWDTCSEKAKLNCYKDLEKRKG